MNRRIPAIAIIAASAVVELAAQRAVLTVGGANATHASLPAAVAAAAPGAVIHVNPGTHTGFATNKPLRVWLDFTLATGSITAPAGANYAIEIQGIPAGQEFVVGGRGAAIGAGALGGVRIANCGGPIVLSGVDIAAGANRTALDVQNTVVVIVQNSALAGQHALQAQDAVVGMQGVACSSPVDTAVVGSRVTLHLAGGACGGTAHAAIRVSDSTLVLAGDGATAIGVGGSPAGPVAAIEAVQSNVIWDPARFALSPANGAPALLRVGGQLAVIDMPTLTATPAPLGAVQSVTLRRATPAAGMIAIGTLRTPYPFAGVPAVWIDPVFPALVIATGTVDAAGLTRQATWPNVPWLIGEMFCLQGVVLGPANAALVSGPGMWVGL